MGDQHCRDVASSAASQARATAGEFFQIAALILGNEDEAVSTVEEALANVDVDPCVDSNTANDEVRKRLIDGAVRRLDVLSPGAFATPPAVEGPSTCIETDDLSAAGLTSEQLDGLLTGPGRVKMRQWLEQLAPALRAIFVLRAVVGQDGERTAQNLHRSGAAGAQGWHREQVGAAYRQALCSLASSLMSSNPSLVPA